MVLILFLVFRALILCQITTNNFLTTSDAFRADDNIHFNLRKGITREVNCCSSSCAGALEKEWWKI